VWPGGDGSGGCAQPGRARKVGRISQELEQDALGLRAAAVIARASLLCDLWRRLVLQRIALRRVRWAEDQQPISDSGRDIEGDPVGFPSLPKPLEIGGDLRQVSLGGVPGEVDGEDLVVLAPGGLRFVDAAREGDPIPLRIGEDAGFGVIVVLGLVRRDRDAMSVARQHHPNFQRALGHHPGHYFESFAQKRILWVRKAFEKPRRDSFLQVVALADRVDVPLIERRADQQAHAAAVTDKLRDAARRDGQRARAEEARAAVVAHAGRKRGDVKIG